MAQYTVSVDGYDWQISTLSTNRLATIKFVDADTSKTAISSIKSLYLAVMDRMDESTEMSDSNPMTADTPTEYNIGKIGAGAKEAWYIDKESVEHLTGGALKTTGWLRVEGSNTGVVKVVCTNTDIVAADIGQDITYGTDNDSGVLLDILDTGGAGTELWIRPDDNTAANSFDNTPTVGGTLTCNAHTATQTSASTTGEMQWSNIYNTGIATLTSGTHQYIYQGDRATDSAFDARVERYKTAGEDWWNDGTFDVLLLVADQAANLTSRANFIDEGYAAVFARKYGATYSYYIVDLFAGGRNPIPLETGADLNNTTGYWTATTGVHGVSTFVVGEQIQVGASPSAERGIITAFVDDTSVSWYQIGDPQDNFDNGDTITGQTSGTTATLSGAPTAAGPGAIAGSPGITFGSDNTFDINADDTNEYYSVVIDCGTPSNSLANMYEWTKYITRNGGQTTANTDGIEAEQYIGIELVVNYTTEAGGIAEGMEVVGASSGATGTIVAIHTAIDVATIRNVRGTFLSNENIEQVGTPANNLTQPHVLNTVTPIKPNPFGIFAGGFWFLAQGVVVDNRLSADANSYNVISDEDLTIYQEPTSIDVAVTNSRQQDKIAVFRLDGAGGTIEKDYYTATVQAEGANTVVVGGNTIRVDEPGKSTGGWLIVGDVSAGEEHVYRYSSWTGSTFTLDQTVSGTADGGDTNTLADSGGGLSGLMVGELIHDVTNSEYAWVTEVTSDTSVETTAKTTTWNGAAYVANDLVAAYTTSDYVYVPLLYAYETTGTDGSPGSESASLVYDAPIPALVRARSATESTYKIKPFGQEITISGDSSTAIVRTTETITS